MENRTAIVTGASRGIGHATALALAEEGFDVAAVALPDPDRMAELGRTVRELGRRFASYALDLADLADHAPVLEAVARDLGEVECLVNNAGVTVRRRGDLLDVPPDSYDRCLQPRWGRPEDVARTVRTLAAGLLPYTVGQEVRVDGGLLLRRF